MTTTARPASGPGGGGMNYEDVFRGALADLRAEGRYRVFADLARQAGAFPKAMYRGAA